MRLDNIREEFPRMPEEMRKMIEDEVVRQLKTDHMEEGEKRKSRISCKKLTVIGIAAAAMMGLTAVAGAGIYQLYSEKVGNYAVKTGAIASESAADTIPEVDIQVNYIPEGMYECKELCGKGKYHYENEEIPHTGGITLVKYAMDSEGDLKGKTEPNVVEETELDVNGHQAICLKKQMLNGNTGYSRIMYIMYPEVQHILQMYVGDTVPEEEMIKMAESIELIPTGDVRSEEEIYTWNDDVVQQEETEIHELKYTASREEMNNLHTIGETIPMCVHAETMEGDYIESENIQIKVTDVRVGDDLSLLEKPEYIDERWKNALDSEGNLEKDLVQYVKSGDGINTLDEVVETEEKAQKLVYITLEYTNTGEEQLKNIHFFHSLLAIDEWKEGYAHYDWIIQQQAENWDQIVNTSVTSLGEMYYYDIHGGERGNNYIPSIAPGETVTLHIANIVHEEHLPYLYLDLTGAGHEFSVQGLEKGYVDIRQK